MWGEVKGCDLVMVVCLGRGGVRVGVESEAYFGLGVKAPPHGVVKILFAWSWTGYVH